MFKTKHEVMYLKMAENKDIIDFIKLKSLH